MEINIYTAVVIVLKDVVIESEEVADEVLVLVCELSDAATKVEKKFSHAAIVSEGAT